MVGGSGEEGSRDNEKSREGGRKGREDKEGELTIKRLSPMDEEDKSFTDFLQIPKQP